MCVRRDIIWVQVTLGALAHGSLHDSTALESLHVSDYYTVIPLSVCVRVCELMTVCTRPLLSVCTRLRVYVTVCVYECVCIWLYMYITLCTWLCVCMPVCVLRDYVHMTLYTWLCECIPMCVHNCVHDMCTWLYAHICVYMTWCAHDCVHNIDGCVYRVHCVCTWLLT